MKWPTCCLCDRPAVFRSEFDNMYCTLLNWSDAPLVPPPVVLDQTARTNAGASPFCLALVADSLVNDREAFGVARLMNLGLLWMDGPDWALTTKAGTEVNRLAAALRKVVRR